MTHTQRSATMMTRDGVTLYHTIHGDDQPGQPRIVLVHSLGMNGAVWDGVAERLVSRATLLVYDCRGHGASTKARGPYSLEMFADDLMQLIDHLGWNSIVLAGASMGGSVSLQFALLHPDRVRGIGLIDTTAWYGADAAERWEQRARQAEEHGMASLIEFQETRWFSDAFRARNGPAAARCRSVFLANDVTSFAATCRMLGAFDLRAGLHALRMPTAVVVGEEDYATPPAMARELQSGIPGATLQVIPKARHLTFVEHPDAVADALATLISRAQSPP